MKKKIADYGWEVAKKLNDPWGFYQEEDGGSLMSQDNEMFWRMDNMADAYDRITEKIVEVGNSLGNPYDGWDGINFLKTLLECANLLRQKIATQKSELYEFRHSFGKDFSCANNLGFSILAEQTRVEQAPTCDVSDKEEAE